MLSLFVCNSWLFISYLQSKGCTTLATRISMEFAKHKHSTRCLWTKMELQSQFPSLIVTDRARFVGTTMELFVDGKDLIINEGKNATTRQWRTAMLLHLTGPHVQDIFSKLVNTGKANNHVCSCYNIKWIFSSQSQLIFCSSEIWPTPAKARWDIFAVCIELKKRKILQFWYRLQQSDKRPCPAQM